MKRILISLLYLLCLTSASAQKDPSLTLKNPDSLQWFKDAKFGMFIHWGLYSVLEGSYNGRTMPDPSLPQGNSWYAEWIQARLEIPSEEYRKLTARFNPTRFDAEQWVEEAKNAGMRYLIITTKHHDGFALWNSKVSDFDIMQTPYRKDVLAQLVKACRKYGMKYGFYYSHWQDWEHPGGAQPNWKLVRSEEEFEKYWQEKSLPQVKELIVKYDPDLLWFDTWNEKCHITPERRDELIRMIRKYSSKCLINGRIAFFNPGDNIDYLEMNDNDYPKEMLEKPWQTPATMQHSWGYHAKDYNWKSSRDMLRYLIHNVSKGGNYLLNVGPKADGTFPVMATRRLREMGAWLTANGEGIYDARPVSIKAPANVYLTQKEIDGKTYVYAFLTRPAETLTLDLPYAAEASVLDTGMPLRLDKDGGKATVRIPANAIDACSILVVKIRLNN